MPDAIVSRSLRIWSRALSPAEKADMVMSTIITAKAANMALLPSVITA